MEELKPCPFCGGEAEDFGVDVFWVTCKNCHIGTESFDTLQEAIEAWNRRANND